MVHGAKKCPRCGEQERLEWNADEWIFIRCSTCGRVGMSAYTKEDAMEYWNNRPGTEEEE